MPVINDLLVVYSWIFKRFHSDWNCEVLSLCSKCFQQLIPDLIFQHLLLGSGGAGNDLTGDTGGGLIYITACAIAMTGGINDSGGNATSVNSGNGSGGSDGLETV